MVESNVELGFNGGVSTNNTRRETGSGTPLTSSLRALVTYCRSRERSAEPWACVFASSKNVKGAPRQAGCPPPSYPCPVLRRHSSRTMNDAEVQKQITQASRGRPAPSPLLALTPPPCSLPTDGAVHQAGGGGEGQRDSRRRGGGAAQAPCAVCPWPSTHPSCPHNRSSTSRSCSWWRRRSRRSGRTLSARRRRWTCAGKCACARPLRHARLALPAGVGRTRPRRTVAD